MEIKINNDLTMWILKSIEEYDRQEEVTNSALLGSLIKILGIQLSSMLDKDINDIVGLDIIVRDSDGNEIAIKTHR